MSGYTTKFIACCTSILGSLAFSILIIAALLKHLFLYLFLGGEMRQLYKNKNEKSEIFFAVGLLAISIAALLLVFLSCNPAAQHLIDTGDAIYQDGLQGKGCEPTTIICRESVLMICNADHEHSKLVDCNSYEPKLVCETRDGKPGCYLPRGE